MHSFIKINPGSDKVGVPASQTKDIILPLLINSITKDKTFFSLNL